MARIQMSESVPGDHRVTGAFLAGVARGIVELYRDAGSEPTVGIEIAGRRDGAKAKRTDCTLDDLVDGLLTEVEQVSIYVTGVVNAQPSCISIVVRTSNHPFLYAQGDDVLAAKAMRMMQQALQPAATCLTEDSDQKGPGGYAKLRPSDLSPIPVPAALGAWVAMMATTAGAMLHPQPLSLMAASGIYVAMVAYAVVHLRVARAEPHPVPATASATDDLFRTPNIEIDLSAPRVDPPAPQPADAEPGPALPVL